MSLLSRRFLGFARFRFNKHFFKKMIIRLAKNLFLLSRAAFFSLFLMLISAGAQAETVKIGYAHGLELFQENETLKQTLDALQSRIRGVEF